MPLTSKSSISRAAAPPTVGRRRPGQHPGGMRRLRPPGNARHGEHDRRPRKHKQHQRENHRHQRLRQDSKARQLKQSQDQQAEHERTQQSRQAERRDDQGSTSSPRSLPEQPPRDAPGENGRRDGGCRPDHDLAQRRPHGRQAFNPAHRPAHDDDRRHAGHKQGRQKQQDPLRREESPSGPNLAPRGQARRHPSRQHGERRKDHAQLEDERSQHVSQRLGQRHTARMRVEQPHRPAHRRVSIHRRDPHQRGDLEFLEGQQKDDDKRPDGGPARSGNPTAKLLRRPPQPAFIGPPQQPLTVDRLRRDGRRRRENLDHHRRRKKLQPQQQPVSRLVPHRIMNQLQGQGRIRITHQQVRHEKGRQQQDPNEPPHEPRHPNDGSISCPPAL